MIGSYIDTAIGVLAVLSGLYALFSVARRVGVRVAERHSVHDISGPVWYRRDYARCAWGVFALGVGIVAFLPASNRFGPGPMVLRVVILASLWLAGRLW